MARRTWANGIIGNTPLNAARLNDLEEDLEAALMQLARSPEALFSGSVIVNDDGAPTSANVVWPDGSTGVYSGTASVAWPGAVNAYTITKTGIPVLKFTQPMVTRNESGDITTRPAITVTEE
ncbi:hypothetical protein [Paenarthrobacter nitroguajacolicus]|uniref:hypothetical protein n=1 Tax=Paenarthrobacter nitroguajacolicus TaxID=211146 RepID=UPI0015B7C2F9|nr:hypothetical protein [Paenarthrobacter nitroguajacolicus]NWL32990.1 hypothetical protein [Paenarthrobacter nitroguajacolicus]